MLIHRGKNGFVQLAKQLTAKIIYMCSLNSFKNLYCLLILYCIRLLTEQMVTLFLLRG
jgi:hypothetical protein